MAVLVNKSEKELQAMAAEVAETISIRSYYILDENGEKIMLEKADGTHGNSRDERRAATPEEAAIIYNLVYAALLSMNWNRHHPETFQAIRDTAEFTAHTFFNKALDFEVNCYDTIVCPLYRIANEWEKEA
ncbi:MAG: hypothetical protein NC299_18325 [Lachnospiraceae bacterium]|nr:hypothetical protein [Lachnospiraceae bacterium]